VRSQYERILDQVLGRYGENTTSTGELEEMLRYYRLTPCEVGSKTDFERSADGDQNARPPFGIYNTDRAPPGTHWFAVYEGYVYDPLGDDASRTPEQATEEDNCGQRCVAYLILCKKLKSAVSL